MSAALDRLDIRILDVLQHDASLNSKEIGERVGLSSSPCYRRIKRMCDVGIITKRVTYLSRKALGFDFEAFVEIKLKEPSNANIIKFERVVLCLPEVLLCRGVSGDVDFILHIVTLNLDRFDSFLRMNILCLDVVSDVSSSVVVRSAKEGIALPLKYIPV
ncbi:MAG: AsnC family transcriptional regulator [Robiginitomaculum sp.]|nr:MAG: AsnC family transcriptional regulator [Robiginitomaculum sp.]